MAYFIKKKVTKSDGSIIGVARGGGISFQLSANHYEFIRYSCLWRSSTSDCGRSLDQAPTLPRRATSEIYVISPTCQAQIHQRFTLPVKRDKVSLNFMTTKLIRAIIAETRVLNQISMNMTNE